MRYLYLQLNKKKTRNYKFANKYKKWMTFLGKYGENRKFMIIFLQNLKI